VAVFRRWLAGGWSPVSLDLVLGSPRVERPAVSRIETAAPEVLDTSSTGAPQLPRVVVSVEPAYQIAPRGTSKGSPILFRFEPLCRKTVARQTLARSAHCHRAGEQRDPAQ
jgi:hypothetical protein